MSQYVTDDKRVNQMKKDVENIRSIVNEPSAYRNLSDYLKDYVVPKVKSKVFKPPVDFNNNLPDVSIYLSTGSSSVEKPTILNNRYENIVPKITHRRRENSRKKILTTRKKDNQKT